MPLIDIQAVTGAIGNVAASTLLRYSGAFTNPHAENTLCDANTPSNGNPNPEASSFSVTWPVR